MQDDVVVARVRLMVMIAPIAGSHMKFDIADDAHTSRANVKDSIAYIWSCRAAWTTSK
jgi:hypothetical protein